MPHLEFLIVANGTRLGPLSEAAIYDAFKNGKVTEESLACVYSRRFDWHPPEDPRLWKPLRSWLPSILELPKPQVSKPLEFVCVACHTTIRIRGSAKGGTLKCPICGARLNVKVVEGKPLVTQEKEPSPPVENVEQGLPTPHHILGLTANCTPQEIKAAYRRRLKEYHPDRVADMGKEIQMLAEKKTKEINWAFEQLSKT
jgi:DNA-directed RNA polymerase subunit RPC12/RpoP